MNEEEYNQKLQEMYLQYKLERVYPVTDPTDEYLEKHPLAEFKNNE